MVQAPLHIRKAVLARLIVEEAIETAIAGNVDEHTDLAARELIGNVRTKTETELGSPLGSTPLDTFVRDLIGKTADDIAGNPRLAAGHPLQSAAAKMRDVAAGVSCAACAGSAAPCDGASTVRDAALVAAAGPCIAPFRDLFTLATEIVREHYAYALGPASLQGWPTTTFETAFTPPDVDAHPYPSATQIAGAARRTGSDASIELIFCPAKFTWAAYLAAGYVLVHEALHLMEGLQAGNDRRPAKSEDPFVEGWIDWIAFHAFELTARGRGPARSLAPRFSNPTAQRELALDLHLARTNPNAARDSAKVLTQRLLSGKRAAERFHDFCLRSSPAREGDRQFLAISFRVNAIGLNLTEHRRLVSRVNEHLPAAGAPLTRRLSDEAVTLYELLRTSDGEGAVNWLLA